MRLERGVVDEHVDAAERVDGLVDDSPAVRRVGDVARTSTACGPPARPSARSRAASSSSSRYRDQDVGALAGERDRDGTADPAIAAGDDRLLPLEPAVADVAPRRDPAPGP